MKLAAHVIVKNEDAWLWYALKSVENYFDEINIIDTGSSDNTKQIISLFTSDKFKFSERPISSPGDFTKLRQAQLSETSADWILILDGDEVWTYDSLSSSVQAIKDEKNNYLVSKYINCVGDVFHYQPEIAGKYTIQGQRGHISVRWFKSNIPGLHYDMPYGQEGLFIENVPLQQTPGCAFVSDPYFHLTHLKRSTKPANEVMQRNKKFKYELGSYIGKNAKYPASFYFSKPEFIPSPWKKRSINYFTNALWQTPLKAAHRLIPNA